MGRVSQLMAREVLDSRGNPTVEVDAWLDSGAMGRFTVPSGASTGRREALELRDGDKKRFHGKGVQQALHNVRQVLAPKVQGRDAADQAGLDRLLSRLDGTANKGRLGANAILGVSLAVAKAAAAEEGRPLHSYLSGGRARLLPTPLMNFINGGAHADNNLDIQEIMVVPHGAKRFSDALRMGSEIFHALKAVLSESGLSTNVGDEGGFAPRVSSNEDAIRLTLSGVERAGYRAGRDASLALDVASTEFYRDGAYHLEAEGRKLTAAELVAFYEDLVQRYPVVSIEDGMAEDDWQGWRLLTRRLGRRLQLVGDDLFVTNPKTLALGVRRKAANAILLKVNQIGTLTETQKAEALAQSKGYGRIVSHRSGETEDSTISHLAVAWETGQIKTGSASRSDRTAKYNELLRIEEAMGSRARFAGLRPLRRPD